jgi:hypothetical protein
MKMKMPNPMYLWAIPAAGLIATSGALGAMAISGSSSQVPSTTVTITVAQGEPGPTGPAGPAGPQGEPGPAGADGAESCPTGSTFGELKFVIQGQGPTSILTCIKNVP